MIVYTLLVLIIGSAFLSWEWIPLALAGSLCILSTLHYILCFYLTTGMKTSQLTNDFNISDMAMQRVVHISGAVVLLLKGFPLIVAFILPWILMTSALDIMSVLLKLEFIEISDVDDDDDDS